MIRQRDRESAQSLWQPALRRHAAASHTRHSQSHARDDSYGSAEGQRDSQDYDADRSNEGAMSNDNGMQGQGSMSNDGSLNQGTMSGGNTMDDGNSVDGDNGMGQRDPSSPDELNQQRDSDM